MNSYHPAADRGRLLAGRPLGRAGAPARPVALEQTYTWSKVLPLWSDVAPERSGALWSGRALGHFFFAPTAISHVLGAFGPSVTTGALQICLIDLPNPKLKVIFTF